MNKVVLDRPTLTKLGDLDRVVEFYDDTGRILGYFCPANRSEYNGVEVPISDEELRHREREVGGFTTTQLLEHLHSLARPENG